MASPSHAKQLEFCPPEVIYHIVEHLPRYDLKAFSYVSKGIRAFCLPSLFRNVQFEFSKDGFDKLEAFLQSGLCLYVVSFIYKVPELLKPEILDYSEFKTQILTPDSYVEEFESRENLDDIDSGDEERRFQTYLCPSYGLVYKTLRKICAGQSLIIRSGRDLALLTLAFQRLPHLTEFGLDFSRSFVDIDWVQSLLCLSMTSEENSAAHHIRVASTAMESTERGNLSVHSLRLSGLALLPGDPWHSKDRGLVVEALFNLLIKVPKVHVLHSDTVLELMRHSTLEIRQLELCSTYVSCHILEEFLRNNINSMESMSFHNVETIETNEYKIRDLCPADISEMAFVPAMKISKTSLCPCLPGEWWLSKSSFEVAFERARVT